ncbi:MAG: formate/nitrite transporter family protein [Xanthobacteraceae bacterium]
MDQRTSRPPPPPQQQPPPPPPQQQQPQPQLVMFDAVMPADMAARAEESGIKRAELDPLTLLVLAVLGGAFVAFGAVFATTVTAGSAAITSADGGATLAAGLPYGIVRLLTGVTFCLGLVLVVVGGAELFTGNVLIVMAWASHKVTTRAVLQNWTLAFTGNFIGAIATAALVFFSTQYTFGGGSVGLVALNTAHAKTSLAFLPALTLAILCNTLVCLAVWMCYGARTTIDRVVTVVPPIAGFAAAGFEHSIANIYFIPLGLFIKAGAPDSFWTSIGKTAADFPNLTWWNFAANLVPVTIGNIIGGAVLVAAVYWFIYLRQQPAAR